MLTEPTFWRHSSQWWRGLLLEIIFVRLYYHSLWERSPSCSSTKKNLLAWIISEFVQTTDVFSRRFFVLSDPKTPALDDD